MKNVVLIVCLLVTTCYVSAQGHPPKKGHERGDLFEKMQELTPEQRAELKTKRMTLDLDLTESQQQRVKNLLVAEERNRPKPEERKKKKEDISSEELYQKRIARLDSQIAMKSKLKEILTEAQYEKFEKGNHQKARLKKRHHMRQGRK